MNPVSRNDQQFESADSGDSIVRPLHIHLIVWWLIFFIYIGEFGDRQIKMVSSWSCIGFAILSMIIVCVRNNNLLRFTFLGSFGLMFGYLLLRPTPYKNPDSAFVLSWPCFLIWILALHYGYMYLSRNRTPNKPKMEDSNSFNNRPL